VKAQGVVLATKLASDMESKDLDVSKGDVIRLGSPPHLSTYMVDSFDINGNVCCKDPTDENEAPVFNSLEEAKQRYN
jgi:hypothetical protein